MMENLATWTWKWGYSNSGRLPGADAMVNEIKGVNLKKPEFLKEDFNGL
jgi:hypothetical protein